MFDFFIYTYGPTILLALLTAVFGVLGYGAKKIYIGHINDETKRAIAAAAVAFVEQAWKALHGADKLNKALETAEALLKKKGITFDAEEMRVLIEAAVGEFNDVFNRAQEGKGIAEVPRKIDYAADDDREQCGLLD